jgi:hypothetical protein
MGSKKKRKKSVPAPQMDSKNPDPEQSREAKYLFHAGSGTLEKTWGKRTRVKRIFLFLVKGWSIYICVSGMYNLHWTMINFFVSFSRDSKEADDENHDVPEVIPLDSLVPEILKLNKITKLHLDQA